MEFKEATDRLCRAVTHEEVAEAAGVSVSTVRQARLSPGAEGRRSPPEDWPEAVAKLARERARELEELAEELDG